MQSKHIASTLPYPLHVDEGFVSGPARRTLVDGTLHPYRFNYPSFPKYLAALGMAAGFVQGASRLEVRMIHHIGNVGYPYYDVPGVMRTARLLFALLAMVALGATGAAAWTTFDRPSTIVIAPLVLAATPLFFYHSWVYLNVDIIGTAFLALTLAAVLRGTREPSFYQSAILPGIFAGLAVGSKYTLALGLLPVLIGIWLFFPRGRRVSAAAAAVGTMVAVFLIVVPYSLIDIRGFLNGVAEEAYHYSRGHPGNEAEPGVSQLLFYARTLRSDFGVPALGLAVVGVIASLKTDWQRAVVVGSLPLVLLVLVTFQRTHFARNILGLYPHVAVLVASGLVAVFDWARRLAARRNMSLQRVNFGIGLLLVVAASPPWHLVGHLRSRTDSRNEVQRWIDTQLPDGWGVVVPSQLGMDPRPVEAAGRRVTTVDFLAAGDADGIVRVLLAAPRPAVALLPRWAVALDVQDDDRTRALNKASERWPVLRTFGTNPVLSSFTHTTPWGDPRFSVVVLNKGQPQPE